MYCLYIVQFGELIAISISLMLSFILYHSKNFDCFWNGAKISAHFVNNTPSGPRTLCHSGTCLSTSCSVYAQPGVTRITLEMDLYNPAPLYTWEDFFFWILLGTLILLFVSKLINIINIYRLSEKNKTTQKTNE
jgi:hypothetical protein